MKPKQILILFIILLVLAGLVFIKKNQKPKELATEVYTPLEISFDSASVATITLSKQGAEAGKIEKMEMKKEGEQWKSPSIWNARVDGEKISQFLSALNSIKGELRANDKSLFPDFGIGDEEGIQVVFQDVSAKELLNIFIGTKKASYLNQFIRKNGSSQVYLTEAPLLERIGVTGNAEKTELDKKFWADLSLAQFEADKVTGIELKQFQNSNENLRMGIVKESDAADASKKKWKFVRSDIPFALDANLVPSFLRLVKDLKAQSILDANAKDYGFTQPAYVLKFLRDGTDELIITVGGEDQAANAQYVNVSGEPVVFQLSKHYLNTIMTDDSYFFGGNPLEVGDEKKIVKLTVSTDKAKMDFSPKDKVWPALSEYIAELKKLKVTKLLLDPAEVEKSKSPSSYFIEIQMEGETAAKVLDAGSMISDQTKDYAAALRGAVPPFAISEAQYKTLFDNLSRLEAPKDAPASAPVSAPAADSASQPKAA